MSRLFTHIHFIFVLFNLILGISFVVLQLHLKGGFVKEKILMGLPVQLEWSDWNTTCWLKQEPHSLPCLKQIYAPQLVLSLSSFCCTISYVIIVFMERVHSPMFSGCHIHAPRQTNTKPFTRLCVRCVCVRVCCTVLSMFTSCWRTASLLVTGQKGYLHLSAYKLTEKKNTVDKLLGSLDSSH